jgi:hypothetical protein
MAQVETEVVDDHRHDRYTAQRIECRDPRDRRTR